MTRHSHLLWAILGTSLLCRPAATIGLGSESPQTRPVGTPGRPVRIVSLSFANKPLERIAAVVDREAARDVDLVTLPETWRGQQAEPIDGPAVRTLRDLAQRHRTYIVCPIYRQQGAKRFNSGILIDRGGKVVCVYDKVYPYWSEFDLTPKTEVGQEAPVYQTDFGRVGMAICFDANFAEVWKRLADQGAELVIWPSAYSAGTTLQAHSLMHHFYIVTSTLCGDCIVYDITGREIHYSKNTDLNIARITLDLDRGIYHQNFNIGPRDRLLKEHPQDVVQDEWMDREQWFVLKAKRPGISARQLARQYGLEELRDYINRSRSQIDKKRGWNFSRKAEP